MALEYQAAQAQQTGAIVAGWIEPAGQGLESAVGNQSAQSVKKTIFEFRGKSNLEETPQSFRCLQGHIADEAVTHDNVRGALEDIIAFDIAIKIQDALLMTCMQ